MIRTHTIWTPQLLGLALIACGCEQSATPPITTEMREDFEHDHKHIHGDDAGHEHTHADGHHGAHSHPHTHPHRHGKPPHDGRIVSIGHTHHKDDVTHYHAEVMPLAGRSLTMHFLYEDDHGDLQPCPVEDEELTAYLTSEGDPTLDAFKSVFHSADGARSTFAAEVPEHALGKKVTIVFPKITLGGERQSLGFELDIPADADAANSIDTHTVDESHEQ